MTASHPSGSENEQKNKQGLERHKDRVPPAWECWRFGLVALSYLFVCVFGLAFAVTSFNLIFKNPLGFQYTYWWIYVPGLFFLIGLYTARFLIFPFNVHEARLVDRTEVEALFLTAEQFLKSKNFSTTNDDSIVALQSLICKRRKEGPSTWTEYRVFTVEQAMVKVLPVKDLISRTHAGLDDLKEYNERRSDIEEKRYFEDQAERINQAIDEVEKSEETKDNLRAELRMLLEIVAYYDKNWAIGSEILRELLIAIAFTVPIFLFIGIAPTVLPSQDSSGSALGFVNWAFFGVAGSLTAVLRKLYLGSKVEVGLTEGKNELYQALKGAILGLVSGVMVYAMLKGGFVENGKIVPDVYSNDPKDIGLSIFWAFITGFMFENFFDKAVREHSQSNG